MAAARRVLVVGAGVSGCACAAELAGLGCEVVLVNSGLDSVGYPGYGPGVEAAGDGPCGGWQALHQALMAVPETVRRVWLAGSLATATGWALLVIDRRSVSIRTKWALEQLREVRLRQGLVTAIKEVPGDGGVSVEVETVFGETLHADACVLAVGLALGGVVQSGPHQTGGGRYAEVPANELHECLLESGVPLHRAETAVGARWRVGADTEATGGLGSGSAWTRPLQSLSALLKGDEGWERVELEPWGVSCLHLDAGPETLRVLEDAGRAWRDALSAQAVRAQTLESRLDAEMTYLPPSPYDRERRDPSACRPPVSCFVRRGMKTRHQGDAASEGRVGPSGLSGHGESLFVPDGLATAEWYASPGGMDEGPYADGLERAGWTISRPEHVVTSWVLGRGEPVGTVGGFRRTWVCGQAGGARSYLESLASGGAVARAVASRLC